MFFRPRVANRMVSLVGSTSPRLACESPNVARRRASSPPLLAESAGWLSAESGTSSTAIATSIRGVAGRRPSHDDSPPERDADCGALMTQSPWP